MSEEVSRILGDAGWTADAGWGGFTCGTCVGGLAPDGNVYVKNWAAIQPGHPKYGPDTPDTAEEAAQWLAERYKAPALEANPLSLSSLEFVREEVETPGDESNGETLSTDAVEIHGADRDDNSFAEREDQDADARSDDDGRSEPLPTNSGDRVEPLDAEYFELPDDPPAEVEDLGAELLDEGQTEFPALEGADPEDFAPDEIEHPETSGGAFIFGDNLDQLRTAAIGRVIRYANGIMPRWLPEDDARLSELRNFVMGVSERRWDDNPANQAELNALETTIRRINEIKNARDTKVEFLEGASREEIEDFAVEANWP